MKKIIVVADDDFICRQVLSMHLNQVNVPVLYSENGKEAFELINTLIPDFNEILLITDLNMPIVDGFELISMLKVIHCKIKIVVTSSHSFFEVNNRIEKSISGYIQKPVTQKMLSPYINEYLNINLVNV